MKQLERETHRSSVEQRRPASARNSRYRYSQTTNSNKEQQFYGFRRDRGRNSNARTEYHRAQAGPQWRKAADHETLHAVRRKLQTRERFGIGLGIILTCATLTTAAIGTDYVWRVRNRGKSFDDLMKTLDATPKSSLNRTRRLRSEARMGGDGDDNPRV